MPYQDADYHDVEKENLTVVNASPHKIQNGTDQCHAGSNLKSRISEVSKVSHPGKPLCASDEKGALAVFIKRNNMELQFWGYEIGNVLATIAGAGGFLSFFYSIEAVFKNSSAGESTAIQQLFTNYPDAAVTVGLGTIVLTVPALRARLFLILVRSG